MSVPEPTPLHDQLWSPVQNTALWLGWWVHQIISTDALIDAFHSIQGASDASLHILDATHVRALPGIEDPEVTSGLTGLLRIVRKITDAAPVGVDERTVVSLVLAGMGDVPPLPQGHAADEVRRAGAGIVVAGEDPQHVYVLIPQWEFVADQRAYAVVWRWFEAWGQAPVLGTFSPGEADYQLREALNNAARHIEQSAHIPQPAPRIRLAVGTLADALGLPGLPPGVAPRAAKLLARADYATAIVHTSRAQRLGSSLDPLIVPLLRAIRAARMTGVDYAFRELVREGM